MKTLKTTTKKELSTEIYGKKILNKFGLHFRLGYGNGTTVYIERPSWDCGWYWGFGYLHTYTNNNCPERSKDISCRTHFDTTFTSYETLFPGRENSLLDKSVLTDKETWKLYELFKTAYTMRNYSDLLHTHGAHVTTNPCADIIGNDNEYRRINADVLPEIFKQIELLLTPDDGRAEIIAYWDNMKISINEKLSKGVEK